MRQAQQHARRAVVISGASTGIGYACALRLARSGFQVFAGVRRQADGEALRAAGGASVTPITLDVTDAATIAAAAEQVQTALSGSTLAGLVNNAGIAVSGPLEFLPIEQLRRLVGGNTRILAWATHVVPDRLRDRLIARAMKLPNVTKM